MPAGCLALFLQVMLAAPGAPGRVPLPAEVPGTPVTAHLADPNGPPTGLPPPTAQSLGRPAAPGGAPSAATVPPPAVAAAPEVYVDFANLSLAPRAAALSAAAYQVDIGDANAALKTLGDLDSPAAALLRARAWRLAERPMQAAAALVQARRAPELAPLIDLELGRLAAGRGDWPGVIALLLPLLHTQPPLAARVVPLLAQAQVIVQPLRFLDKFAALQSLSSPDDPDAKSLLWEQRAQALDRLGRHSEATAARLQRYLLEPVSQTTPLQPPAGTTPSLQQQVDRIEKMVAAHRNERAIAALTQLPPLAPPAPLPEGKKARPEDANERLTRDLFCRRAYLFGLAARKLRHYAQSEEHCSSVLQHCAAYPDLLRKAAFVRAKVISIRDGLRAIGPIDQFTAQYPDHSMADDALFWAGDMYQRRGDLARAEAYYRRIDALPTRGDFCAEARWRVAWMAWRRGDLAAAATALQRLTAADGCVVWAEDVARAHYWLGRVAQQQNNGAQAAQQFSQSIAAEPHGFYAQSALPALLSLQNTNQALPLSRSMMAPRAVTPPRLCARGLEGQPEFQRALAYLRMGLSVDAADQLAALQVASAGGPFHASDLQACGPAQATLLLVLLQQQVGADRQAYVRLRRAFGESFGAQQTPHHMALWRAAYPLAFRDALARGEQNSHLPNFFLQALAREESAFDPKVVSWAEAYGLTQLLLSSARDAGRMLRPPRQVGSAEELLDPNFNAELGAALFSSMARRVGGNLALGLVSYNAGSEHAALLRRRFAGQDFMTFAEEVHIAETRAYVKRVLKTYGIYRWLYAMSLPSLPIDPLLQ